MIPYPEIKPEIFRLGPLAVRWYGLMYVVGYFLGFQILKQRCRWGLIKIGYNAAESMITHLIVGMLIGARLIYAFVYNWDYYSSSPFAIFKVWEGGLSFHGAAIGMIIACTIFARKHKLPFYQVTDALAIGAAPGLFFGRLGNFMNAELYGRKTDVPWAMVFPTDPEKLPRHPSQLYQAVTEGLLLATILFLMQDRLLKSHRYRDGIVGASFLIGYGLFRFVTEFAREPDKQLGFVLGPFSMGQLLCFIMVVAGALVMIHVFKSQTIRKIEPPDLKFLEES